MKFNVVEGTSASNKLGFLYLKRSEALALIKSLSTQLLEDNPNTGRLESRCNGDVDMFTVFVMPEAFSSEAE